MKEADKIIRNAAHGLIYKNNKFLITRRAKNDDYMPGLWDLPGGTIDHGEEIIDALNREIFEETNLKIKKPKIIFVFSHLSGIYRHQTELVYQCDYKSGKLELNQNEHDDFKWVTLKESQKYKKIAFLAALIKELSSTKR